MDVYEGVYFNDFIKSRLAADIHKRIIMNGMTGNRWRIKQFNRLFITVNSNELMNVGK